MMKRTIMAIDQLISAVLSLSSLVWVIMIAVIVTANNYRKRVLQTIFKPEKEIHLSNGKLELVSTERRGKFVYLHFRMALENNTESTLRVSDIDIDYQIASHRDEITILDSDLVDTRRVDEHESQYQRFKMIVPWELIKNVDQTPYLHGDIWISVEPTFSISKISASLPEVRMKRDFHKRFPDRYWEFEEDGDKKQLNELDWETAKNEIGDV